MTSAALLGDSTPDGAIVVLALALLALGIALFYGCIRSPMLAVLALLTTTFLRLALPNLGVDPFVLAFGMLVVSVGFWLHRHGVSAIRAGITELAMVAYLLWCLASMVLPHTYQPVTYPLDGSQINIFRFIVVSTLIPFTMFFVARNVLTTPSAIRAALWAVIGFGAYSSWVSIAQFHAPALVWPRYIVTAPNWEGRANGVMNQPVGNGMILVITMALAIALASSDSEPRWRRWSLWLLIATLPYAIYLSHTRAAYLGLVVLLLYGLFRAKGFRRPFALFTLAMGLFVVLRWSTLTSADRDAGGVTSVSEIDDRLNIIATAFWAFEHKPLHGWGIGRFVAVNTFHHQQWSQDVPWARGYGIASHFNELGILAELGLIGLLLWLTVLVGLIRHVLRATRDLPRGELLGGRLAFVAAVAMLTLLVAGSSVDLRLLDLPPAVIMLLVGLAVGARDRHVAAGAPGRGWADPVAPVPAAAAATPGEA